MNVTASTTLHEQMKYDFPFTWSPSHVGIWVLEARLNRSTLMLPKYGGDVRFPDPVNYHAAAHLTRKPWIDLK